MTSTPLSARIPSTWAACGGTFWFWPPIPSHPRRILPSRMSRGTTYWAVLMGVAKHSPWAPRMMAVLTPITSPCAVTSGPPELPGFKRRIGLDHVVDEPPRLGPQGSAHGAHHTGCHGAFEAKRVSNGDDELADAQRIGVTKARGMEPRFVDAHHGEVRVRVVPHEVRGTDPAVVEHRLHARGTVHDVAVGQHETIGCKDEAGAGPGAFPAAAMAAHLDVDHRGARLLHAFDHCPGIGIQEGDIRSLCCAHRGIKDTDALPGRANRRTGNPRLPLRCSKM